MTLLLLAALLFLQSPQDPSRGSEPDVAEGPPPVVPPAPAPASPPAEGEEAAGAPRDLRSIARVEAKLAEQRFRERILTSLKRIGSLSVPALREQEQNRIIALGTGALPYLLEMVGHFDQSEPQPDCVQSAAIAIQRLLQQKERRGSTLANLRQILLGCKLETRRAVTLGLQGLDDPALVTIASDTLGSDDQAMVLASIELLASQSDPRVPALLRPLLRQEEVVRMVTIRALNSLGDAGSSTAIVELLGKNENYNVDREALRFLKENGDCQALPRLRQVIETKVLNDLLVYHALDAVQAIGLRQPDTCLHPAEEILLQSMRNATNSARENIAMLLGPFRNDEAYETLTKPLIARTRQNANDVRRWLDLAEVQLRFGAWNEALDSARKAERADSKEVFSTQVNVYRIVAYCGREDFTLAERYVKNSTVSMQQLLQDWPVLRKMADHPKYHELFQE